MNIKRKLPVILAIILMSCSEKTDKGHDHDEHEETEAHAIHNGHDDGDEIVLEPHAAEKFGVKTSRIERHPFNEVIKVSGVVVGSPEDVITVVAKSAGVVSLNSNAVPGKNISGGTSLGSVSSNGITGGDADKVAALQYEAAKKEYERVIPLYKDGIVSAKDYNAAQAAYQQAKAAYSGRSEGSVLTSPSGGVITELLVKSGEYVSVGQPVATVSRNSSLLLRADVPQKYYSLVPSITSANFCTAYSDSVITLADMGGRRISAPSTTPVNNPGYLPVYFSFDNDGSIVPGSNVEVYLLNDTGSDALVIPVSALSEQQGALFAYVKVDEHGYEKRVVKTGVSNGREIEILSGLNEGEEIVTEGVIFVKLAETSNVVPEGHSHNH